MLDTVFTMLCRYCTGVFLDPAGIDGGEDAAGADVRGCAGAWLAAGALALPGAGHGTFDISCGAGAAARFCTSTVNGSMFDRGREARVTSCEAAAALLARSLLCSRVPDARGFVS